jgi:hypothetical protein
VAAADGLILSGWNPLQTGTSFTTFTLDETADYYAVIFRANGNTIAQVFTNFSAVTGSATVEVSIQGVSSGIPDGTIKASGNAKVSWSPTAAATWQTLTSSYASTAGESLAYVVKLTSGSGTSVAVNVRVSGTASQFPVGITYNYNNNVSPTTTRLNTPAVWGVKGSGTDWCDGNPISSAIANSITTASIIESGMVFVAPSWVSTMRLVGCRILFRLNASSATEIRVYSGNGASDTTVAQSITVDSTELQSSGTSAFAIFHFPAVTLNASQGFRITCRPTTGTFVESQNTVIAAEDAKAYGPLNGFAYRTRRTTGNWTDSTTNIISIDPIFDDVTAPSGSAIVYSPKRTVVMPRPYVRKDSRSLIVQQTTQAMIVPVSSQKTRVVVRSQPARTRSQIVPVSQVSYVPLPPVKKVSIREVRTQKTSPTQVIPVATAGVTTYVPIQQPRRIHVQQSSWRRAAPAFVQYPVAGPTVYIPIRQPVVRHSRPTYVVKRAESSAVFVTQSPQQVILFSSPRVVR